MADDQIASNSEVGEDTHSVLKSVQSMMSTLIQKVSDIENKYDELRGSIQYEREAEINEVSENEELAWDKDKGNQNASHSFIASPARGRERDNLSPAVDRVDSDKRTGDGCVRDGSKDETRDVSDSVSETESDNFLVSVPQVQQIDTDIFSILEAELEVEEQEGKPVDNKLAKITRNRFTTKLSEQKLKDKMDKYLVPENCTEIKPPLLNEEIVEKGNLDRAAKKSDARLSTIQKVISKATAALVNASERLHTFTTTLTAGSAREDPNTTRCVESVNDVLRVNGDILALLGTAHQELSYRRRYQLQSMLPKDMASLCSNNSIPITDKLFGGDIDKIIKSAKESFKIKHSQFGSHRSHPYRRGQNQKPFLGQATPLYSQRGNFSQKSQGRRWNQYRGFGKMRGKH